MSGKNWCRMALTSGHVKDAFPLNLLLSVLSQIPMLRAIALFLMPPVLAIPEAAIEGQMPVGALLPHYSRQEGFLQ